MFTIFQQHNPHDGATTLPQVRTTTGRCWLWYRPKNKTFYSSFFYYFVFRIKLPALPPRTPILYLAFLYKIENNYSSFDLRTDLYPNKPEQTKEGPQKAKSKAKQDQTRLVL